MQDPPHAQSGAGLRKDQHQHCVQARRGDWITLYIYIWLGAQRHDKANAILHPSFVWCTWARPPPRPVGHPLHT